MKGAHCDACVRDNVECLCNTCKHDTNGLYACCVVRTKKCPAYFCSDYEPDDEEDDNA